MRSSTRPTIFGTALTLLLLAAAGCGPTSSGGPDGGVGPGDPCNPGDTAACYDGPTGTEGVGVCSGGTRTCEAGFWSGCEGDVVPSGEVCGNGLDENCNQQVDEVEDLDNDGFTGCDGDCCDSVNDGCTLPELVNPGAFESVGNTLDDDCDGMIDEAEAANCDGGLPSNSAVALDYAKAMDLCQMATGRSWGVVDAALVRADGNGAPSAAQHSIRTTFGGVQVQGGTSYAVLSSGNAAAVGQTNPGYVDLQAAPARGGSSGFPMDWLNANGGNLPNAPGCPEPDLGLGANDPVMLRLRIKAPTNAKSFRIAINFLSSEYPEWVCSPFNDFFVVLLDSTWAGMPANPMDKNLAVYTSPANARYPVGVNLGHGDTGLFRQCVNGPTGCGLGSTPGNISTCTGVNELIGTGLETVNPGPNPLFPDEAGFCGANNREGGGTGWLVTTGNVKGGETITLRIGVWDTSDGLYDSTAIIDKFEWSVDAAEPGTVIP